MTGIFLSQTALRTLSASAKAEVMACLSMSGETSVAAASSSPATDFTLPQWRKFLERCSPKTRGALKEIAMLPVSGFKHQQIADALFVDMSKDDLRGVWGGITKRTRAILGDSSARVIAWEYRDDEWHGQVSPATHAALKTALGV